MKAAKQNNGKIQSKGAARSKTKVAKGEPLSVGRMLRNVKDKLAGLRLGAGQAPNTAASAVVDLAKKRDAKKAEKAAIKTKAPSMKDAFKKTETGSADRAENANVRSITKQAGRKGLNAHPALGNVGARHH